MKPENSLSRKIVEPAATKLSAHCNAVSTVIIEMLLWGGAG